MDYPHNYLHFMTKAGKREGFTPGRFCERTY